MTKTKPEVLWGGGRPHRAETGTIEPNVLFWAVDRS